MKLRRLAPQLSRHALQLGVVGFVVYTAFGGAWRNYKVAHNHRRIVGLIEGEGWGRLYGWHEDLLALAGDSYQVSLQFLGFPWAARIAGLDSADPILALDHLVRTGAMPVGVLLGLLVPVALALLLGKVFCSHLCPMRLLFEIGQRVRTGLLRIGLELPELRSQARLGGWTLLGGLLAAALSSGAVWLFILPYASFSAGVFLWITSGALSLLLAVVLAWFLVDLLFAPGYFCHNLCPTGFVLEQLGKLSTWRVSKIAPEPCPSSCALCQEACPYALAPQLDAQRPACDNCGACVAVCPTRKLSRTLALPLAGALALALLPLAPPPASAHHNKGLPHYGYFENYPQVPVDEYVAVDGRWEISATIFNFQGMDRTNSDTPNDVKIYLALYDLEAGAGYTGPLDMEIVQGGETISRYTRVKVDEEAVYSTRETLPRSGEYTLRAQVGDETDTLPFEVDLASDGVSWGLVAGILVPVALLFVLALLGGRRQRLRKRRLPLASTAALLLALAGFGTPGSARAETGHDHAAAQEEQERCHHCNMVGCTMVHHETRDGGSVMVMPGLPVPVFLAGVAGVIVFTFVATEWIAPRSRRGRRFNLIKNRRVYRVFRSRWLQAVPQLAMLAMLVALLYAGLFGSRVANVTPVAVWTLWWGGLIFAVLFLGSAWCFVCPWDGLANLASRLRAAARVEPISLGLPFPRWLQNVYPALVLFVLLTWFELGYGVTTDPRATAYMGLAMAGLAVAGALLWDGKRFCAHGCPVGRICGVYANFSPVEIRPRKLRTCQVCTTEECLHGNERGYPCPTGISLKTVQDANDCTMCTECIKSCDKHNVALNLRPFGDDLRPQAEVRMDRAWLALALLCLTLFHGLTMTSVWESFEPGGTSILKWLQLHLGAPASVNFSIAMAAVLAIPVGLYWACCRVSSWWAGDGVGWAEIFAAYAVSLVPVALFYHLAHNLMHLLMEAGSIVALLSDPLGRGWDLFGTADRHVGSLVSDPTLWGMQVALILVGHVFGILVAYRVGHKLHRDPAAARRSLIPIPALMVAISVCGLWLMHLDMNMRVGRM